GVTMLLPEVHHPTTHGGIVATDGLDVAKLRVKLKVESLNSAMLRKFHRKRAQPTNPQKKMLKPSRCE
ncbi:MAG: hypothetical protein II671_03365, partial [Salinivirgaceae bacterium]|nr:hypothetical protein [Salinivirgaceae bacterium]